MTSLEKLQKWIDNKGIKNIRFCANPDDGFSVEELAKSSLSMIEAYEAGNYRVVEDLNTF